ncbi:MAG: T9SS type A sorting domain-containing protein, partial [Flavobacteriales bacterium]
IQTSGTSVNVPAITSLTSNTFYILSTNYDGSRITQYVNNASAGTAAYNGTLRTWPDMSIGVQAGFEGWDGDIAEVIAFTVDLNSAQQVIMANYLAAKYSISLGADDIYVQDDPANGNYDHEVAGIGRISATSLQNSSRGSGIVQISAPTNLGNNEFLIWGHDNGVLGYWGVGDKPSGVQGRLGRTWRVSEVNKSKAAVDVGAIDMTFDLTGLGSVTASDLRLLVDSNNDGLFADETPISGAVSIGSGQCTFPAVTAIKNNVRFTLGTINSSSTPLPIELISFNATPTSFGTVELTWATASEQDNAYFSIERSADLMEWSTIGTQPGAGNSSFQRNYADTDRQAMPGTSYYRLRQTDLNGVFSLSDVVPVTFQLASNARPLIMPNPSSGPFTVRFPMPAATPAHVELVDAAGRVIWSKEIGNEEPSELWIDPLGAKAGDYFLRITSAAGVQVEKILLLGR